MSTNFLFFSSNGMPRLLVRRILFHSNRTPRKPFRRLVIKKNGTVRPVFLPWVGHKTGGTTRCATAQNDTISEMKHPALLGLERLRTPEENASRWKHGKIPAKTLSERDVEAILQPMSGTWLLLSVGHDDYTTIPGGVQVCIQREQRLTTQAGGHYLNIHPWQPLPRMAHVEEDPDPHVVLVLDGAHIGVCRMSVLSAATKTLTDAGLRVFLTIHHLLGHSPERIAELGQSIRATNTTPNTFLWLHDFFTLCPATRLQRNDLEFCGAPDLASNACGLCVYGQERQTHLDRIKHLFAVLAPMVLAPSQGTLDLWRGAAAFRIAKSRVVPHLALEWTPGPEIAPEPETDMAKKRIRVGFLGTATHHKGWPVFERMSYSSQFADRFEFVGLTASEVELSGNRISVNITPDHPNAMADAVRTNGIDLVLHWPNWPETFALTAFEALEGGAFLITNEGSGNVAATVRQLDRGAVLTDEDALFDFFDNGDATALVQRARDMRASHSVTAKPSRLSLAVFEETF